MLDPLVKLLAEGQLAPSKEAFLRAVEVEDTKFRPLGEKVREWATPDGRNFEVYSATVAGTPGFREYHARLQPWIMFFIDAASYIDVDDENWQFFVLFERYGAKDAAGGQRYAVAGYATVYEYYAYPAHKRPRISQLLVLPPFQGRGHGARVLDVINDHYRTMDKVVDITVEDPSDAFVRLRDFVDARNCLALDAFAKDKLKAGYSEEMTKASNEKYKICRRQSREGGDRKTTTELCVGRSRICGWSLFSQLRHMA